MSKICVKNEYTQTVFFPENYELSIAFKFWCLYLYLLFGTHKIWIPNLSPVFSSKCKPVWFPAYPLQGARSSVSVSMAILLGCQRVESSKRSQEPESSLVWEQGNCLYYTFSILHTQPHLWAHWRLKWLMEIAQPPASQSVAKTTKYGNA